MLRFDLRAAGWFRRFTAGFLIFTARVIIVGETKCFRFTKGHLETRCGNDLLRGIWKYKPIIAWLPPAGIGLKSAGRNLMPSVRAVRAGFSLAHTKAVHLFISPKFRAWCTVARRPCYRALLTAVHRYPTATRTNLGESHGRVRVSINIRFSRAAV